MVFILQINHDKSAWANLPKNHKGYATLLDSVDAEGGLSFKHTKKTSMKAREKAMMLAKKYEKQGWKLVALHPMYTYGYDHPYRYDIEAWGEYK